MPAVSILLILCWLVFCRFFLFSFFFVCFFVFLIQNLPFIPLLLYPLAVLPSLAPCLRPQIPLRPPCSPVRRTTSPISFRHLSIASHLVARSQIPFLNPPSQLWKKFHHYNLPLFPQPACLCHLILPPSTPLPHSFPMSVHNGRVWRTSLWRLQPLLNQVKPCFEPSGIQL